jgi:hypothetical protein
MHILITTAMSSGEGPSLDFIALVEWSPPCTKQRELDLFNSQTRFKNLMIPNKDNKMTHGEISGFHGCLKQNIFLKAN